MKCVLTFSLSVESQITVTGVGVRQILTVLVLELTISVTATPMAALRDVPLILIALKTSVTLQMTLTQLVITVKIYNANQAVLVTSGAPAITTVSTICAKSTLALCSWTRLW